ncbi:MAG: DUF4199 domain-containing protein [Pseudomonadota bacterium]
MGKIAGLYGAAAGVFIIASLTVFGATDPVISRLIGYATIAIGLSVIFFAVKRHRDLNKAGAISFLGAFLAGLAVAGVAGLTYVIGWEVYLYATDYRFMEEYAQNAIARQEAAGLSGNDLDAFVKTTEEMMKGYRNPAFRIPITFLEIFPVGFAISALSAFFLKRKNG